MKTAFKISSKVHHAIMMVCFLSDYRGKYAAPTTLISERLDLSQRYLEKVAKKLKAADILESYRGSAGGYRLKKKIVSMLDVIRAIEGEIKVLECVGGACEIKRKCPSKTIWPDFQKKIIKTLESVKIV
ncbi:RrF2 family transcriptional regulator [Patescibacteria group bacterium]